MWRHGVSPGAGLRVDVVRASWGQTGRLAEWLGGTGKLADIGHVAGWVPSIGWAATVSAHLKMSYRSWEWRGPAFFPTRRRGRAGKPARKREYNFGICRSSTAMLLEQSTLLKRRARARMPSHGLATIPAKADRSSTRRQHDSPR